MAAYKRQTWVDDDGSLTVGTMFSAALMNNIEEGISETIKRLEEAGFGVVYHAAEKAKARPTGFDLVFWIGSVQPTNAEAHDVWLNTAGASAITATDWGVVSALPELPNIGDFCTFKAATGVYWRLIYTGEATYPWAKIGGPPLSFLGTGGSVAAASPGYSTGEIVAPLAMEYTADFGNGLMQQNPTAALTQISLEFKKNGTTQALGACISNATFVGNSVSESFKGTCAKSDSLRCYYAANNAGSWNVQGAWLKIDPVRVG